MNQIGPRVKKIRESKQWTQEQLVVRCQLVGFPISRGTLAKIEARVRRITDIEAVLLAKALDVSVKQLYQGSNPPK